MSSLSAVEAKLPPGFRFHPRDQELICDYLMKWVTGCPNQNPRLIDVDLNKFEPWDIPKSASVGGNVWYFYNQRDRKYATGVRTNRATISGYWKATGKDRPVIRDGTLVGMRKTLVFYKGRAPKGRKTEWVMHEFRLEGPFVVTSDTTVKEDWVLCRVFYKNKSELVVTGKQETGSCSYDDACSSQSLPGLMEPYIAFENTKSTPYDHQASANDNQYHEQVPCFSIFDQNYQTNPSFSLISHADVVPPELCPTNTKIMPNFGAGLLPDHGISYNPQSLISSTCDDDKKMIQAVLNHLTKIETSMDELNNQCSSFGDGSSDSYLSEVGLSSMWNQYS